MSITIRILTPGDEPLFNNVAPEVYDHPLHAARTAEFLRDPRHHLVVALDADVIVGSISAVHYLHPDKPQPELWINEVAVAPAYRQQGIAKQLLAALLEKGRAEGWSEAWVLTDRSNTAALRLYASLGGLAAPKDSVMFTFPITSQGHP